MDCELPKDILLVILSFVDSYETKFNLWQTCKLFRENIQEFKNVKLEGDPKVRVENISAFDSRLRCECDLFKGEFFTDINNLKLYDNQNFWILNTFYITLKPIEFLRPVLRIIDFINKEDTSRLAMIFNGEIKIRQVKYVWVHDAFGDFNTEFPKSDTIELFRNMGSYKIQNEESYWMTFNFYEGLIDYENMTFTNKKGIYNIKRIKRQNFI